MENQIVVIQNVRGYCDEQGTAWLNAEDVARGLGWTQEKNGVEYVRWETINGYLAEFDFPKKVGKDDFIPENMLYRLIWKSRDEKALEFQSKVADEILPSIRKTGSYSKDAVSMLLGQDLRPACVYALELSDGTVKIGVARNLKKRINGVARGVRLRWLNVYHTRFAPFSFMRSVVKKCHKAFADKWLHGEFFAVPFEHACAELYRHNGKIESAARFLRESSTPSDRRLQSRCD